MSELKTAEQHEAPVADESEFTSIRWISSITSRRCAFIFIAILCAVS